MATPPPKISTFPTSYVKSVICLAFAGVVVRAKGLPVAILQLAHGDGDAENTLRATRHPVSDGVVLLLDASLNKQFLEPLAGGLGCGEKENPRGGLVQPG